MSNMPPDIKGFWVWDLALERGALWKVERVYLEGRCTGPSTSTLTSTPQTGPGGWGNQAQMPLAQTRSAISAPGSIFHMQEAFPDCLLQALLLYSSAACLQSHTHMLLVHGHPYSPPSGHPSWGTAAFPVANIAH